MSKDQSNNNDNGPKHGPYRIPAMIMAGIAFLQVLRLALNTGLYTAKRFHISEDEVGLLVARVHNSMELTVFITYIIITIYVLSGGPGIESISIFVAWANCTILIILAIIFSIGGERGYLTLYYWALIIGAGIQGLNQFCAFKLAESETSYFVASIPVCAIEITIYQILFKKLYIGEDFDYWIVFIQAIIGAIIAGVAAFLWTLEFLHSINDGRHSKLKNEEEEAIPCPSNGNEEQNGSEGDSSGKVICVESSSGGYSSDGDIDVPNTISAFLMTSISFIPVYAFYPSVLPFKFIAPNACQVADKLQMVVSALPGIMICMLDAYGMGPGIKWKETNGAWNAIWAIVPIYIIIQCILVYAIHNPESTVALINGNFTIMAVLTVLFMFIHNVLLCVGFSGVPANSNGNVSTINSLVAMVLMNLCAFIGDGYVKTINKHDPTVRPSEDMNLLEVIYFWVSKSIVKGLYSMRSTYTFNLRQYFTGDDEEIHYSSPSVM